MKKYNYFYDGTPITKLKFEYIVPLDWEIKVVDGEYSWGHYKAIEIEYDNVRKQLEINKKQMSEINLNNCKRGDILISSHGAKLEYIAPTPWKHLTYLDHVVKYVEDKDGKSMGDECYGTRTNDGFVYKNKRIPETDHDIVEVISL